MMQNGQNYIWQRHDAQGTTHGQNQRFVIFDIDAKINFYGKKEEEEKKQKTNRNLSQL